MVHIRKGVNWAISVYFTLSVQLYTHLRARLEKNVSYTATSAYDIFHA